MDLLDTQRNKEIEEIAKRKAKGISDEMIAKRERKAKRREKKEINRLKYIEWCKRTGRKLRKETTKRKVVNRKYKSYSRYVLSPLWERRKNLYWKKYKKKCDRCQSIIKVHLHHAKYIRPFDGEEPDETLFPLCFACHTEFHNRYGSKRDMTDDTIEFIKDTTY